MTPAPKLLRVLLACGLSASAVLAAGFAFVHRTTSPRNAGVVVVETNLAYENAEAAGTGIVLRPSGEMLTNNHVIRGATTIRVVVPGSGRSYSVRVLGYSVAADVAVLRLVGASGLRTASLAGSARLRLGQPVTAVGNAGGSGTLASAGGRITGLGETITAGDDQGGLERLTGLIKTDAGVQPGDSGGPLLDASNHVVGLVTAASAGFFFRSSANGGFAIPIRRAAAIAKQIVTGHASESVHVGATAFLGVGVTGSDAAAGAVIADVVGGSPADGAGLEPGDVVTALDGRAIASPETLTTLLLRKAPGDTVRLAWSGAFGDEQTASVTLASGPPQ